MAAPIKAQSSTISELRNTGGSYWLSFHWEHLSKCCPALSSYHGICAGKAKVCFWNRRDAVLQNGLHLHTHWCRLCRDSNFSTQSTMPHQKCFYAALNFTAVNYYIIQKVCMFFKAFLRLWKYGIRILCVCFCERVHVWFVCERERDITSLIPQLIQLKLWATSNIRLRLIYHLNRVTA